LVGGLIDNCAVWVEVVVWSPEDGYINV
jgi:hypothetical protein